MERNAETKSMLVKIEKLRRELKSLPLDVKPLSAHIVVGEDADFILLTDREDTAPSQKRVLDS